MTNKRLRYPIMLLASSAVAIIVSCGDDPAAPGPGTAPTTTTSVSIVDNGFQPAANMIEVAETVTWLWTGSNPHNVTFDDERLANSVTKVDGSFQQAFDTAGEFTYFCSIHGRAVMSGRVVVGDATNRSGVGAGYP